MATLAALFSDVRPQRVSLSAAQTGTGASTNVCDRGAAVGPAHLKIVSTIGATPSATVSLEGSADGTTFFSVAYATSAAPETPVVTALTITTATTAHYILRPNMPWRYFRLHITANTNVTLTADLTVYP